MKINSRQTFSGSSKNHNGAGLYALKRSLANANPPIRPESGIIFFPQCNVGERTRSLARHREVKLSEFSSISTHASTESQACSPSSHTLSSICSCSCSCSLLVRYGRAPHHYIVLQRVRARRVGEHAQDFLKEFRRSYLTVPRIVHGECKKSSR